jgi:hypothetical protein
MNREGKTDLGLGIREVTYFLSYTFMVFSYWGLIEGNNFGSQLSLTLAGAAMSVWITLTVIERVIKKDRDMQWEKVKSLTYMTILNNIRYMVSQFPETSTLDLETMMNHMDVINTDVNYPRKDVSDEIIGFAKDISDVYKNRREFNEDFYFEAELSDEESEARNDEMRSLIFYYGQISWIIEDMRITLIPRVLQLGDDEEVNLALLRFEAFSREFLEDQRTGWSFSDIFCSAIQLLDESGRLYEVLQRKMPPQNGDFAYHFREPTPYL